MGLVQIFGVVVALLVLWAVAFAANMPIRQAYINSLIPSRERATVLSFDSMVSSTGRRRVPADPREHRRRRRLCGLVRRLGRDRVPRMPFLLLARREHASADLGANGEKKPSALE